MEIHRMKKELDAMIIIAYIYIHRDDLEIKSKLFNALALMFADFKIMESHSQIFMVPSGKKGEAVVDWVSNFYKLIQEIAEEK